jgi:hypothetical protein
MSRFLFANDHFQAVPKTIALDMADRFRIWLCLFQFSELITSWDETELTVMAASASTQHHIAL